MLYLDGISDREVLLKIINAAFDHGLISIFGQAKATIILDRNNVNRYTPEMGEVRTICSNKGIRLLTAHNTGNGIYSIKTTDGEVGFVNVNTGTVKIYNPKE